MEVAGLHIAVESSDAKAAEANLKAMTGAAKGAETASRSMGGATAAAATQARAMAGAATQNVVAMNATAAAATRAAASTRRMGGSMSGLGAQFQDIGVTAAMGMNPMIIALQQGTQIAGQMEMAMQSGGSAAGVLGAAFKSLISPIAIVSIGLTALAAVGLQIVNWEGVIKGVLYGVATGLEVIAPYAVAAAAALALLYAPAIVSGIGTATGLIRTMAMAVWGLAAAIYAAVGLPALLIAGFLALVAAAVVWRDDLTKMLGVDIVGAAKTGINALIGGFGGGFSVIQATWARLPSVIGDLAVQSANAALKAIHDLLQQSKGQITQYLFSLSSLPEPLGSIFRGAGAASASIGAGEKAPQIANPYEGAAAALGQVTPALMSNALGKDYVGEMASGVQNAASGAADALRDLAGNIDFSADSSKKAAKEAERQAKAYADLTRGAQQFIAGQNLEAQSLGMTEEAANRLRYAQELLNKAANDNIDLTPKQTTHLTALGAAMAAAEEQTRRLTEIYDTGKDVFSGFFSDASSYIRNQSSEWKNLGDVARSVFEGLGIAGANALQKIADKALEMAANGIWDMIFGAIGGALSGGFGSLGNDIGAGAGSFGNFTKLMSFDGGGYTGMGARSGGIDGIGGFPAILHPNETVTDHTRGAANQNQANGNGSRRGDTYVTVNGSGLTQAELTTAIADALDRYDRHQAPVTFQRIQNDPLARG